MRFIQIALITALLCVIALCLFNSHVTPVRFPLLQQEENYETDRISVGNGHISGVYPDMSLRRGRGRRLERHKHRLVRQPTQLYYTIPSTSTGSLPSAAANALALLVSTTAASASASAPEHAHVQKAIFKAALGNEEGTLLDGSSTPYEDYYANPEHFPMEDLVDIIITVEAHHVKTEKNKIEGEGEGRGEGKIAFLEQWKEVIQSLHCIVILANDVQWEVGGKGDNINSNSAIKSLFPTWMKSFEVYTYADIVKQWGDKAYLAGDGKSKSHTGISSNLMLRNFGFWVSDRTVVYAIDANSDPSQLEKDKDNDCNSTNGVSAGTDRGKVGDGGRGRFTPLSSHSKDDNIHNSRQDHIQNQHQLLRLHLYNLFTPATPIYFDVNYDSYKAGMDFSKGYPYPLRQGVHTGVSHGLSTGDIGYDKLTRLSKPYEQTQKKKKNEEEKGVTMTIPHGSMYSMQHNNIAYNRRLVGAMFFYVPPTSTDSDTDTDIMSEDYIDIVSGWIIKTVSDHVGIGVKSGAPYVHRHLHQTEHMQHTEQSIDNDKDKNKNKNKHLQIDAIKQALYGSNNGTFSWQDELLLFLSHVKIDFGDTNGNVNKAGGCSARFFSPEYSDLNAAIDCCYKVLANLIETELVEHIPALKNVPRAMKDWLDIWHSRNTFIPTKHPMATYASLGPLRSDKDTRSGAEMSSKATDIFASTSTCAVITIVRDEQELLPLWIRYYSRHVPLRDIYILDHLTTDNSTHPSKLPADINYKVLYGNSYAMPVVFRSWQINKFQDRLLRFGYKCVIFSDTDEIIVPNPIKYPHGLRQYLHEFLLDDTRRFHRVKALEVGHVSYGNGSSLTQEPAFDWNNPYILSQRRVYISDKAYDKPLLSKVPLRYRAGFHKLFTTEKVTVDENLIMLHMRSFDVEFCMRREEQKYNMSKLMKPEEIKSGMANHWTTYHKDKKSGDLCKYAQSSFFGEQNEKTQYLDNTGRQKMQVFGDEWKNVPI